MVATQTPQRINASISGSCTELVCFRLDEGNAQDTVEELRADRAGVQSLPPGSWLALNRISDARLAGRVF